MHGIVNIVGEEGGVCHIFWTAEVAGAIVRRTVQARMILLLPVLKITGTLIRKGAWIHALKKKPIGTLVESLAQFILAGK